MAAKAHPQKPTLAATSHIQPIAATRKEINIDFSLSQTISV